MLTSHERPAASATASIHSSGSALVLSAAPLRHGLLRERLPRRPDRRLSSQPPRRWRRMVYLQKNIQQADRDRAIRRSNRGADAGTTPERANIARPPERGDRPKAGGDRGVHRSGIERPVGT